MLEDKRGQRDPLVVLDSFSTTFVPMPGRVAQWLRKKETTPVDFWQPPTVAARTRVMTTNSHQSLAAPLADNRGNIMVEYAALLALVAIGLALAMVSLGVPLVRMYLNQRTVLMLPSS